MHSKSNAKIRSEYIKNRLDDLFPNINWSVFLYTNGYCKVSFDKNYYICAKINGYYTIIFGHEKNVTPFVEWIRRINELINLFIIIL